VSKQTIELHCSRRMCDLLVDILRQYTNAAYPKGGSECSQSARESLLMSVEQMLEAWDSDSGTTYISRRLRVPLKSAIGFYVQQLAEDEALSTKHRQAFLLSVLKGEVIDDDGYHAALQRDLSA
jgi:hypothetical protein